jgi:hypothetical protein
MSFEEMQQMAATPPPPPPPPAPEPSPWQEPAPVSFDDFASPAPPAAAPEPEAENDSPFGAPPPTEAFSSETRAFPRMSLEEMQQMTSGGISIEQPSAPPEEPPARVVDEPPAAAASPWDEEAPAFSGETRAFPKLNFDDFAQQPPAPEAPAEPTWNNEPSPFGGEAEAPAFGGETRAFPKMNFDDFQQTGATPEPEPEPQPEPSSTWDAPATTEPELFNTSSEPFAESAEPFNEASTFEEPVAAPEAGWMAPPAEEEPAEAPAGFTDQAMPEDMPFSTEPAEEEQAAAAEEPSWAAPEEPAWSLPEGGADAAEASAEPEEPAVVPSETALVPEAPPMPIAARSDLTDEQVDRIARRVVELISDQVVRNIAWEVIPDLAEMVVKERIRQLEAEA